MTGDTRSLRQALLLLAPLCMSACKGDDEQATAASEATTGGMTGTSGSTGAGAEDGTTQGVPTTTADPTAPTTGEPVACDSPEGCTAMGGGEITSTTVPLFRGKLCVSDALRPGDALAVSVSACMHPCLTSQALAFKWVYRCPEQGCQLALVVYYPEVTGSACPSDVFGEFDPAGCEFTGPDAIVITPPEAMGNVALLLPFLTNEDAGAIAGGDNESASVWARVDGHAQAADRSVTLDVSPGNAAPPMSCAEGTPGCTCSTIGLP